MEIPKNIIDEILRQNKVTDAEVYNVGNKKTSVFLRGNQNSQNVLVKIISKIQVDRVQKYLNEQRATELLSQRLPGYKITGIIDAGYLDEYFWLIRLYWDGSSLAPYFTKDICLYGYDEINQKLLMRRDQILPQISEFISSLQSIDLVSENSNDFKIKRFHEVLQMCHLDWQQKGFAVSYEEVCEFYERIRPNYFHKDNLRFAINDLVPANIFIGNDGKLIFSDFEWFGIDHIYTDKVFLWLYFWRHQEWQAKWIELAFANGLNQDYFRFAVIRHVANWCANLFNPNLKVTPKLLDERKEYANHIWLRYLLAGLLVSRLRR